MKATADIDTRLPHSITAERTLLGVIGLNNAALDEALSLSAEDFFVNEHRKVFQAMRELSDRRAAIDWVTLTEALWEDQDVRAAGGPAFISGLGDDVPAAMNVTQYVKIIRDKSLLRKLIFTADAIKERAAAETGDADALISQAAETVSDLALRSAESDVDGKTYRDAAISYLASIPSGSVPRVHTGIVALDEQTGGFMPDELVTLTAGTGVGKTLLAQQIRRRACSAGLHGLYCSAEMTAEHLVSRELATESRVPHWKLRRPQFIKSADMDALTEAATRECDKCKILDGELSIQKIRVAARRKKKASGLGLVVLDYDELIDAPGKDEMAQQRYVIRAAKGISTELSACVIVISQLRKSLDKDEAKKPTLERIYGSGAKSKHSSWILFVDREYVRELSGDETAGRVCILKGRDGRVGEIPVKFNVETLRFEDGPIPEPRPEGRHRRKPKEAGE